MDRTIRTILYYWIEKEIPEIKRRHIDLTRYLQMTPGKIIVVTGFRRTGKTFLLYGLIKDLLKDLSKEEVIHIDFNDERIPPDTTFLTELIPVIRSTFEKRTQFLFLDELQEMNDWSRWLRRIHDQKDLRLFLTGSSSKVSSREIPSELRGRALEVEIFPLSFKEFLNYRGVSLNMDHIEFREMEYATLKRNLDEYLKYGGMPEVVDSPSSMKVEILQEYFRTVVGRDIVERYKVQNEAALKAMLLLLLNSTRYSVSKLHNTLKSQGHSVGKTTLFTYLGYVESSYFMNNVNMFSYNVKDPLQYPRKQYFIDNGFLTALSTTFGKDIGRSYENCVAIELLRRGLRENISYWRDDRGWEVDFVIRSDGKVVQLIQVCSDLDRPDTVSREIRSLIKASNELDCDDLLIIGGDRDKVEDIKGSNVRFVPLWKYLLVNEGPEIPRT